MSSLPTIRLDGWPAKTGWLNCHELEMFCFVFSGTFGRFEWSGVQVKGEKKREWNIGFSPRRDVAAFKNF